MKRKLILIILLLFILFSVSCTSSAQKINDNNTMTTDLNNIEVKNDDVIKESTDDLITDSPGTFSELQTKVNNADEGGTIYLNCDYTYDNNTDTGNNGITIEKNLTIDGQGHTLDGSGKSRMFYMYGGGYVNKTVKLYNINFVNGCNDVNSPWNTDDKDCDGSGSAIFSFYNLIIENCTFTNNSAYYSPYSGEGGAIKFINRYGLADLTLRNCNFSSNFAHTGSAIDIEYYNYDEYYTKLGGNLNIDNCIFTDNLANSSYIGGTIHMKKIENINISNSQFLNNKARIHYCNNNESDDVITLTFYSAQNYMNAIYFDNYDAGQSNILLENVTYWNGTNQVNSNDVTPTVSEYLKGLKVILEIYSNATGELISNNTLYTDENGEITYQLTNLADGKYNYQAYHLDDDYYAYYGIVHSSLNYTNSSNFARLQALVDKTPENSTLNLARNFTYDEELDNITEGILINKSLTINGNGFTIDAKGKSRIFKIAANKVTLNNITLINGNSTLGDAIYLKGNNITVTHCIFKNNNVNITGYSSGDGIAIWLYGDDINIEYCDFINWINDGGAVYWDGNKNTLYNIVFNHCNFINNTGDICGYDCEYCYITNCNFVNSHNEGWGGSLYLYNDNHCIISDCNFINTSSNYGGAILLCSVSNVNIINCNFTNISSKTSGGAISCYLKGSNSVIGCNFINVTSGGNGGALCIDLTEDLDIVNSTFIDTYANISGSAIYSSYNNHQVTNCIFINNKLATSSITINNSTSGLLNISFNAKESYINALYHTNNNRYFEFSNVTYWNGSALVSSDDVVPVRNKYPGVSLVLEIYNDQGLVKNVTLTGDVSELSYDYLDLNPGNYSCIVYHIDDNYYGYTQATATFSLRDKIYVNGSLTTDGNGSIDNPYNNLKSALENACNYCTILIAPGTYTGSNNYHLTIDKKLTLTNWTSGDVIFNLAKNYFATVSANELNITGLSIENGYSIYSYTSAGLTFKNGLKNSIINANFTSNRVYSQNYENVGGSIVIVGESVNNTFKGIFKNNHAFTGGAIYISSNVINNTFNVSFIECSVTNTALFSIMGNSINNTFYITSKNNTGNNGIAGIYVKWNMIGNSIDGNFINNDGSKDVAAIKASSVINSTIKGNFINNTNNYNAGGAILITNLINSTINATFISNYARTGGAIYISQIINSTISGLFVNNSADNSWGYGSVIFSSYVSNTKISGEFINNTAYRGGAIYLAAGYNTNIAANFINNTANECGGCIALSLDSPLYNITITGNFTNNHAGYGGIIYSQRSSENLTLEGNFTNNSAKWGGVIYGQYINSTIKGIFINNSDISGSGGVINAYLTNSTIEGVFINNSANAEWDAILRIFGDNNTIKGLFINNTLTENNGSVISYISDHNIDVEDSIFLNNEADYIIYSNSPINITGINWFGNTADDYTKAPSLYNVNLTWLFLNATVNPSSIHQGESAQITYNLYTYDNTTSEIQEYDSSKLPEYYLTLTASAGSLDNEIITNENNTVAFTSNEIDNTVITASIENINYSITIPVTGNIYVNGSLTTDGNGSINNPYNNLESALNKVIDGCNIYIAPGTYTGKTNTDLTILNKITLSNWTSGDVIFDAESKNIIFNIQTNNVTLNNLIFKNGYDSSGSGGAIYWVGGYGILNNCCFIGNSAKNRGGAIYWMVNYGCIKNCSFINNTARNNKYGGGAILWNGNNGIISDCIFINNTANYGGAIYVNNNENITLNNCNFTENNANYGGAIIWYANNSTINRCNFIENNAKYSGSAIYFSTNDVEIENSIFLNNTGNYIIDSYYTLNITGNNWFGNTADDYTQAPSLYNVNLTGWYFLDLDSNGKYGEITLNNIYNAATNTTETDSDCNLGDIVVYLSGVNVDMDSNTTLKEGYAKVTYTNIKQGDYYYVTVSVEDVNLTKRFFKKIDTIAEIISCNNITYSENLTVKLNIENKSETTYYEIKDTNNKTVKSGLIDSAVLIIEGLDVGEYNFTVYNIETEMYEPSNASCMFSVYSNPATINITVPTSVRAGESFILPVTISDDATGQIFIKIDGAGFYADIVNGTANVKISDLTLGVKTVEYYYLGDGKYSPINGTFNLTVLTDAKITNNKDVTMLYYDGSSYTVRIIGEDGNPVGAGNAVVFSINGKKITAKTDSNGYASLKITETPKTYTITATYNSIKVSNKIVVKQILKSKNKKVKKSAKKLVLKATLSKVNGKYLKGKVIKFKFKGKTYKAKTNKKGVAKIKIKKKVIKKLKKGKKYKVKITYIKDTITKKVKVKK